MPAPCPFNPYLTAFVSNSFAISASGVAASFDNCTASASQSMAISWEGLSCRVTYRFEEITCVKSRCVMRGVEDALRCCHRDDSIAGLLQNLLCLATSGPSGPCLQ